MAILTDSLLSNYTYREYRQKLLEKRCVEAVIKLPSKLFEGIFVNTSLLVFSENNEKIRFVNASDYYIPTNNRFKDNALSDENIEKIYKELKESSESSVLIDLKTVFENSYSLYSQDYTYELPKIENPIKLKELIGSSSVLRGSQIKLDKSSKKTNHILLSLGDIENGLLNFNENTIYLNEDEIPEELKNFKIEKNDIVISKIGSKNFKTTVVDIEDKDIYASSNFFLIKLNGKINPYYLQAYFLNEAGSERLKKMAGDGTVIKNITKNAILELEIPSKLSNIQNRIVVKYKEKSEKILSLKKELKKLEEEITKIFEE